MQIRDVTKVPAKRAPEIGEHNEEVLKELASARTKSPAARERRHRETNQPAGVASKPASARRQRRSQPNLR